MYTSKMIRVQNCPKNVFHNIHVLVNELKKNSQAKLNEKNGCIHVQKLYEKKNNKQIVND